MQEETFKTGYMRPDGQPTYVTANYIRERGGAKVACLTIIDTRQLILLHPNVYALTG